jgi:hypothetical protein
MSASLRALLAGAIDYAGMFPPAKLPLAEAFRNYLEYRECSDAWMLGRFICPPGRLSELGHLIMHSDRDRLVDVSTLLLARIEESRLVDILQNELGHIRSFDDQSKSIACVTTVEIAAPLFAVSLKDPDEIYAFLENVHKLVRLQIGERSFFYELANANNVPTALPRFVRALALDRSKHMGFKVRCGGVEPLAFPSPERLANTLAESGQARLQMKLTAGLHHPLCHYNQEMKTEMHGFVNVLVAGVLTYSGTIGEPEITELLADQDSTHFAFDDHGLAWKEHRASLEQIQQVRQTGMVSFGSCSFDEPRDDLRKLGWLL